MLDPTGPAARPPRRLGRSDRTAVSLWFWEIDRVLLFLALLLISIGLIAVAAASPSAAHRYANGADRLSDLYYFWRQLGWVAVALPVMLVTSMLSRAAAKRFALAGAAVCLLLLMLVPLIGTEVNGAHRWLGSGMARIQPSEFFKPFFAVAVAWLLSLRMADERLPVVGVTAALTALVAVLLMMQPDFGQTVVIGSVWATLVILAGLHKRWMIGGGVAGLAIGFGVYSLYPVARARIDGFLFAEGDMFQVERARATITAGGWFGRGPGAGEVKFSLPEAQTDYIFSVIGEEFGLIACGLIVVVFALIVLRAFVKLLDEDDPFAMLAAAGLATQLGVQAAINMAVNVNLAPSKGMTLPFISYGGSSMIALAIGYGLLLAFTRRNPYLARSPYRVTWTS